MPADIAALLAEGRVLMSDRKGPEAFLVYHRVLAAEPNNFAAHRELGFLAGHSNRMDVALHHLRMAARSAAADDVALFHELGQVCQHCGFWSESAAAFRRVLQIRPQDERAWFEMGVAMARGGQADQASPLMARVQAMAVAQRRLLRNAATIIEPRFTISYLGEMVMRLGTLAMSRAYGWIDLGPKVVVDATLPACNPHLVGYLEPFFTFCRTPQQMARCRTRSVNHWTHFTPIGNDRAVEMVLGWEMVLAERKARGLPPLLSLRPDDGDHAKQALAAMGLPPDAWYVILHCRSAGFHATLADESLQDAHIATYLPALAAIVARGGWVIRMGNAKMPKLPPMPGVIDYVHTGLQTDRLDVALAASARMAIGSSSGFGTLPQIFGVPVLWTNITPHRDVGAGPDDLVIFKRLRRTADGRDLTFAEMTRPPLGSQNTPYVFDQHGITSIDNTAEEIQDAAMEMLDRGKGTEAPVDDDLWPAYCAAARFDSFGNLARPAGSFLARHSTLLPVHNPA